MSASTISIAEYLKELQHAERKLTGRVARYFPASFNYTSAPSYPRPLSWKWKSAADALREFGSVGVMMRLALASQLEVPLWSACKDVNAFIYVSDRENMPLSAAAVKTADIDTIVTDSGDATRFGQFLKDGAHAMPERWLLIHDATQPLQFPQLPGTVAHEVHLFPGAVLLFQCTEQRKRSAKEFHLSDEYRWGENLSSISASGDDPVPFKHVASPFRLEERGTCACSKLAYSVQ